MSKVALGKMIGAGLLLLLLGLVIGRCSAPSATPTTTTHTAADHAEQEPETWTCSMHPQIQQPDPGDCPICGMDLIPLDDAQEDTGPRTMTMSASAKALADVQTSVVERRFPEKRIRMVGTLDYDETRVRSLTARFPARIEELFVNYTGIRVNRGEHLAMVYSPELLTAQRELLTAHERDPDSTFTAAAREKLRQWDLLPTQIEAIITRGEALDHFELRAPLAGVVTARRVKEGSYVETGDPLFTIVDLSRLWLRLEAFPSDIPWLRYGQDVTFTVEAHPGESFTGTIAFIAPEVDRLTRTTMVRVNVPNPEGRLRPGMFARGTVTARLAEGGQVYVPDLAGKWISPMHPEIVKDHPGTCDVCGMDLVPIESMGFLDTPTDAAPLIVPASAVLRTGERAVVYVADTTADKPTFHGREIALGPRADDVYIVREGLEAGELVVTEGAFKIDAALQIQAKPSMMSARDDDRAEGDELNLDVATAQALLSGYLRLQGALASDDLAASRAALDELQAVAPPDSAVSETLTAMAAASDLDGMRRPHFEDLSNALIAAVKATPDAFQERLYLMHCPMVYPDRGADWLQADDELRNPYYGAMMLHCGEIRANLTKPATEP